MTMNTTWGYKFYDDQWKSTETIVRNLIDIASKGGNYLLNVGPTCRRRHPATQRRASARSRPVDETKRRSNLWTTASPFLPARFGRVTSKPGRLTCMSSTGPEMAVAGSLAGAEVKRVYLLARPNDRLQFKSGEEGIMLQLPANAPIR
jgi:alpha-L-fucosidase